MDAFQQLAGRVYYGNALEDWAKAALISLAILIVAPFRVVLDRRLKRVLPAPSAGEVEAIGIKSTRLLGIKPPPPATSSAPTIGVPA